MVEIVDFSDMQDDFYKNDYRMLAWSELINFIDLLDKDAWTITEYTDTKAWEYGDKWIIYANHISIDLIPNSHKIWIDYNEDFFIIIDDMKLYTIFKGIIRFKDLIE